MSVVGHQRKSGGMVSMSASTSHKRTNGGHRAKSASCQQRTSPVHRINFASAELHCRDETKASGQAAASNIERGSQTVRTCNWRRSRRPERRNRPTRRSAPPKMRGSGYRLQWRTSSRRDRQHTPDRGRRKAAARMLGVGHVTVGRRVALAREAPRCAVVAEITPVAQRGALLAIGTAIAGSAGLLAPYIMGSIIESATTPLDGFNTGFFICGVIMLVGGGIAMAVVNPERMAKRRSRRLEPLTASI